MSTSSTSSTTSSTSTTGYQLSSLGNGSAEQITGLASGLNTDQIVQEEMSIYEQPVTNLQNQVTGLTATNTALTTIQSALQTLAADAQALGDPSLFDNTQAVTSSDPTAVTATSSTGAGIGGYEVAVTQLANSAQSTYNYSDLSGAGTITITTEAGPQQVTIPSGESITDFVNSINSNSSVGVYAAATTSGSVIFSDRQTGSQGSITVSGPSGTIAAQSSMNGQDAQYTVDGGAAQTSASNTVNSAIAGVTLTFNALTGSAPATIDVAAPSPSASNIESAINTFTTQYNTVISDIETQLSTAPSSSSPGTGTLYDDPDLSSLLATMRESIYTSGSGLPTGMANLEDIGISTGATTGTGAVSQSALSGNLSLDTSTLQSALASNPSGVEQVLRSWSLSFSFTVNNEAAAGGTIDQRIQGDDSQVSDLQNQISSMQQQLNQRQTDLINQFAQMEAALSQNQSQASSLTSEISSLPGA